MAYPPDGNSRRSIDDILKSMREQGAKDAKQKREEAEERAEQRRVEREEMDKPKRDAFGRILPGSCLNPRGRPPKIKGYALDEPRLFWGTQIDVNRNGKTVRLTRRAALREKTFELAMQGKATAMRLMEKFVAEAEAQTLMLAEAVHAMADKYKEPGLSVSYDDLRLMERLAEALSFGTDPILRAGKMDIGRSVRRRERKEREARLKQQEEKRLKREARKAKSKQKPPETA